MQENEIWLPVKDFEEHYQVSNLGRLRRMTNGYGSLLPIPRLIDSKPKKNGYKLASLSVKSKIKYKTIHRMVATAHIPNPDNKPCIDHLDTVRVNNYASNLRWCTHSENNNNPISKKKTSNTLKGKYVGALNPNFGKGYRFAGEKNHNFGKKGDRNPNSKPVNQMDKNGNFIKRFSNAHFAANEVGCQANVICMCCNHYKHRKTAAGCKWEYA
jgi:hypothetical protein